MSGPREMRSCANPGKAWGEGWLWEEPSPELWALETSDLGRSLMWAVVAYVLMVIGSAWVWAMIIAAILRQIPNA